MDYEYVIKQDGYAGNRRLHDLDIRTSPDGVVLAQEQGLDSVLIGTESVQLLIDTLRQFQAMREPA